MVEDGVAIIKRSLNLRDSCMYELGVEIYGMCLGFLG